MNGSRVMPKTAGMESRAKARSVVSTTNSTRKSGVARQVPVSRTRNFCPA